MLPPFEAKVLFLRLFSMVGYDEDLLARKDMSKPVLETLLISGPILMLSFMRQLGPRGV